MPPLLLYCHRPDNDRKAPLPWNRFPISAAMDDSDLKELIDKLTHEAEISYRRRLLHGRIDMLRTELSRQAPEVEGRSVLEEVDVDRLANILAGKATPTTGLT